MNDPCLEVCLGCASLKIAPVFFLSQLCSCEQLVLDLFVLIGTNNRTVNVISDTNFACHY